MFYTDFLSMRNLEQLTLSDVIGELVMSIGLLLLSLLSFNTGNPIFGCVLLFSSLLLLVLGIDDFYLIECRKRFLKKKNTVNLSPPCFR